MFCVGFGLDEFILSVEYWKFVFPSECEFKKDFHFELHFLWTRKIL